MRFVMADEIPRKKKPVVLTDRQKREMFIRVDTERYTQKELADWYGCSESYIRKLLGKRETLHLEGEEPTELFDSLDMKNVEDSLGAVALKIAEVVEKLPVRPDSLSLLNRTAKTLLDMRKQLREMPKDLHDQTVPINFEAAMKLAMLIPQENREEYMHIMRGLAQTSDLDAVPKYKARPDADSPPVEEPDE